MKKPLIFISALILLSMSFVSCDMIEKYSGEQKHSETGDASSLETKDYDGAMITHISSSSTSLTVKIENNTESTWQSGNMRDYTLEVERDGQWYSVKQIGEMANTMELMIFSPGQMITHTFEFAERYGTLDAGKYRVVKSYWANRTATEDAHEFTLVCEFTVE